MGPVAGVATRAAVANPNVEKTVWSERELATIVIGIRLANRQERRCGALQKVSVLAFAKAHDLGVAGRIGVVDEDEAVVLVERAIRDSEQTTLAALLADAVG